MSSLTKEVIVEDEVNFVNKIDWVSLSLKLDVVELKMLQMMYSPKLNSYVLDFLFRGVKSIGCSKTTVWRKVKKLERCGLVRILKGTKPLIIEPIDYLEKNIKNLIKISRKRFE